MISYFVVIHWFLVLGSNFAVKTISNLKIDSQIQPENRKSRIKIPLVHIHDSGDEDVLFLIWYYIVFKFVIYIMYICYRWFIFFKNKYFRAIFTRRRRHLPNTLTWQNHLIYLYIYTKLTGKTISNLKIGSQINQKIVKVE
jgi:hypothetical protein